MSIETGRRRHSGAVAALLGCVLAASGCSAQVSEPDPTTLVAEEIAEVLEDGVTAQAEGREDEAEELFGQVAEADPDNRVAWFNLGILRRARGDLDGAIEAFSVLVDEYPELTVARYQRAITSQMADDLDSAIVDLRVVVEQDPSDEAARQQLGALLVATGDEDAGRELLGSVPSP